MNVAEALAFGLVQGLTEFLPVSSSGHLALMKNIWGLTDIPILFDILLHLSTLLAVFIVFRRRLGKFIRSILHGIGGKADKNDLLHLRLIALIILTSIITAILGIAIDALNPGGNITLVSICFLITALILLASTKLKPGSKDYGTIGVKEALFLGLAQGLGVFPGISRSGITISAGMGAGLSRESAGELSFIISIPAIIGAAILKFRDLGDVSAGIGSSALLIGMAASFISGLLALIFLMRLVRQGRLFFFAFYLILPGIAGLIFL